MPLRTAGRLARSTFFRRARLRGAQRGAGEVGDSADTSRMTPSASTMPGFSAPACPKRTSFMSVSYQFLLSASFRAAGLFGLP